MKSAAQPVDANAGCGAYNTWLSHAIAHRELMATLARHADHTPEARLWLAVIDQSVCDAFTAPPRNDERETRIARKFFASPRFSDVCELIGLCPEWARWCIQQYAGPA